VARARKSASGLGPIGEAAAGAKIRDLDGQEHELQELWSDRTAVLVFLRHFG
jgi:hypothetical protein